MTDSAFHPNPAEYLFGPGYHYNPTIETSASPITASEATTFENEQTLNNDESVHQQLPPREPFNLPDPTEDKNLTILTTPFFLGLIVIYIGFCRYCKRKVLSRIENENDNGNGELDSSRWANNRAVLDESISTSSRARKNEEEAQKLEERKGTIKKALMSRLIVDEKEEFERKNGAKVGDDEVPAPVCAKEIVTAWEVGEEEGNNGSDEAARTADEEVKDKGDIDEEEGFANIKNVAEVSKATKPSLSSPQTLTGLKLSLSPCATSLRLLAARPSSPPPPISPSRLSEMYADAVNCTSKVASHATAKCPYRNHTSITSSPYSKNSPTPSTISLSAITVNCGEECSICLSQFQVADRAAWNKHHTISIDKEEAAQDDVNNSAFSSNEEIETSGATPGLGCKHVFHEKCISRWLMVKDGCPICRRSYFPQNGGNDEVKGVVDELNYLESRVEWYRTALARENEDN